MLSPSKPIRDDRNPVSDPSRPLDPQPLLYTVEEVCRITRLSRAKVYQLLASGELPSRSVGRCRRIEAGVLRRWIADLPEGLG